MANIIQKVTAKTRHEKIQDSTDYVSAIEKESIELLELTKINKKEIQNLYPKIANNSITHADEEKADSLMRASENIKEASKNLSNTSDEFTTRIKDIKLQNKKKFFISAPANSIIDKKEYELNHFASGINFYKMSIICFVGSFLGVVSEMIWCIIKNGYIESRAGLVYGPFNILYGAGAMLLTWFLYKYRNRNMFISFWGAVIVGSALEYFCSWGQEFVLGSRSWDYSNVPFNINGRICLLYSLFWGVLGVLWIKNLYPRMCKLILKIPNKIGKILTWCTVIFMVINITMSGISLFRWSQRVNDIPPSNGFWQVIDERFPDERMEKVYANMEF